MALSKTTSGLHALKGRSSGLSGRQRAALILVDGQRSLEDIVALTAGAGVTHSDVELLLAMGLVADEPGDSYPVPLLSDFGAASPARDHYRQAYEIATRLTAALGSRGGKLNLAVEAAGSLQELQALAPHILAAVGPARFAALQDVLQPR